MTTPLRILFLEDVPSDAELVERELSRSVSTFTFRRVEGREAFLHALADFQPDLILSDHALPQFSGMDALTLARQLAPTVPFIFVTGSLNEETAVTCIKAGAADYVLKENLVRLGNAVQAALELARTREALRRSEEQLLHAQKLEAVARLAGGIAHDFNNLLTAITGYTELLLRDLAPEDPRSHDVQEIRLAADRAAALTGQLLAYSRRQLLEPRVLDLGAVVQNTKALLRRVIGENIDLVTRLDPNLGKVTADPNQLEQVVMNLAVNSRDAMPDGGTLLLETANAELDQAYAQNHAPLPPGSYVMLAVSDTGTGMDQDVKAHLFEPFFTTKGLGKGTGLGLATVYGIVNQSGGYIWVDSEVGVGTTFKIYFPRVYGEPEAPAPALPLEAVPEGDETVLLVEDEEAVRAVAASLLRRQGYVVLEAGGPRQALEIATHHAGPIDLLLTDVVMPDMNGREVADKLVAGRPALRVLYVSGYTDDAIVRHGVLEPGTLFLQKPFTPATLGRKVREVLDGTASPRIHTEST